MLLRVREYCAVVPISLTAATLAELSEKLAIARDQKTRIDSIDLGGLNRILEHTPEDMTVTVEAGVALRELQAHLARRGQWLPIDPPFEEKSIGSILATNASGPRRFGYGTVRDWLIGLRVALADGTTIKSGGNVVKNVAGYELAKLFVGSHGTLGVIVEATFKLRPLPEVEAFVQYPFDSLEAPDGFLEKALASTLVPTVIDLHNVGPQLAAVLGFAGAQEDVKYQLAQARELGAEEPTNLSYEKEFWHGAKREPVQKFSVLPSRVCATIKPLGNAPFVARAGNGIIQYRGTPPARADIPRELFRRVKDTFDPHHLFPELPQ